MDGNGDGPAKLPPESKGKGKRSGDEDTKGESTASGSLMKKIMQSARSSVTPANLASLMAANGKVTNSTTSAQIPEQSFEDARQPNLAQNVSGAGSFRSNSFQQTTNPQDTNQGDAYRQFAEMGPSRINLGIDEALRSSSPVFVGPYSSAQALDAALHDQVRASSSRYYGLEEAWNPGPSNMFEAQMERPHRADYDEAWSQAAPNAQLGRFEDMQRGANIDRLLQHVSLSDQPSFASLTQPNGSNLDFMNILDQEERIEDVQMSDEQVEMHRSLHELQKSKDRADERIRPPDDDALARTGVYAATPEEALRAIWEGSAEGQRASDLVRDSTRPGESVSRRIRELLKRGSYVDDVYGIPPQLEKTIVAAEEPETEENQDRRAKAISRLDALYRHLGASTSSEASIDDFVKNW